MTNGGDPFCVRSWRQKKKRPAGDPHRLLVFAFFRLAAQTEVGDELAALEVLVGQVGAQAPALADLYEQAAAAVMMLFVELQMLGELVDRGRQNGDLDVGRSGVVRTAAVLGRQILCLFFVRGTGNEAPRRASGVANPARALSLNPLRGGRIGDGNASYHIQSTSINDRQPAA
jgi:hypothetical protein